MAVKLSEQFDIGQHKGQAKVLRQEDERARAPVAAGPLWTNSTLQGDFAAPELFHSNV